MVTCSSVSWQNEPNLALWLSTQEGKMALYYVSSSMSRQDEPNLALWLATQEDKMTISYKASSVSKQDEPNLATQAGKMALSCLLEITHCVPQKRVFFFPYTNPLLTKLVRSRWLHTGLVLFWRVYGCWICLGPWPRKISTWPISCHLNLTLGQ